MFTLVYPPESPCGCGSGNQFGNCCLKNGQIKLSPKSLDPKPPITYHQHKKCILGWTNNCCTKISGDHFVSASVLRILNEEKITISTPNFTREHSIHSSSLKVNKLCRRHNSALSPIDREAARFFRSFTKINEALNEKKDGQKLYFFHGTDIENWLMKTLVMIFHSKQSNITSEKYQLPHNALNLFRRELRRPFGLYIPTKSNSDKIEFFQTESAASVVLVTKGNLVCGIKVSLGGLPLTLMIDGDESDFSSLSSTHSYRPKNLLFFSGADVYCMSLTFNDGSQNEIWYSHRDASANIPSN